MSVLHDSQVVLEGVSKRYNIYDRPVDRLKEILWRNRKCYHREFWSLRDFSYNFKRKTTAIIGPNGSGKSTLLQIIAGVLQPTVGNVTRNGLVTAILELGAGFQPEYTGRENVMLNGMILGIPPEEMRQRVEEIAAFAEIGDFFDQPIKTYSSGMVVRLAFACATAVNPDILLIDEALAVGDGQFERKCVYRIVDLQSEPRTIIFVSHNMYVVRDWCQEAIFLHNGKIVASGEVNSVVDVYEEFMASGQSAERKIVEAPTMVF